jgi:hypothetical protein
VTSYALDAEAKHPSGGGGGGGSSSILRSREIQSIYSVLQSELSVPAAAGGV